MERPPHCLAMVTPAWPPGAAPNGNVTYTAHLAPAFRERGVRTVLLAWDLTNRPGPNTTAEEDGDVVDIARFQPGRSLLGRAAARARRLLPASDFGDAKFAMMVRSVRWALAHFPIEILEVEEAFGLASRIIKLKRIPVVTRLQGPWFLNGEVLGVKKDAEFRQRLEQERLSIAWADAITSPSQDILDRTRDFYGLPLEGARVIPCPIDPRPEDPTWKLAQADPNRILFVGRFDLHKGGDVMIDAFARLAASRPELWLDFMGPDRGIPDGSAGHIGVVEFIRRRISDASVARRIVIHGQKRPDEIDDFRRRAFVTVVPSRYETFGYTAAEALRIGCPLVAADSGGLREVVRGGETGLLFSAGNAALLAGQIDRLLGDSALAARLGEAGRRDVSARYHPTAIAESTLDLYASVVERWRPSRARGGLSRPTA